jgi:hypothetical protein
MTGCCIACGSCRPPAPTRRRCGGEVKWKWSWSRGGLSFVSYPRMDSRQCRSSVQLDDDVRDPTARDRRPSWEEFVQLCLTALGLNQAEHFVDRVSALSCGGVVTGRRGMTMVGWWWWWWW